MTDGYPDEDELKELETWDFSKRSIQDFLDFIVDIWWMPSWGWNLKRNSKEVTLECSTGGWSGNESIIDEMEKTHFWYYNVESRPGGHYKFIIPVEDIKI